MAKKLKKFEPDMVNLVGNKKSTTKSTVPVSNWPTNKNKNAVAEAVAKRKPVKKEEDNNSWVENMGEIVDLTGISSYDDVYRAYKNTGLSGETGMEVFGALPLLGKISKVGKGVQELGKGLGLTSRQATSLKNARIGSELIANSGRGSDAVQAALGSKDNSGFTYTPNDDNALKYNGRNIFPTVSSENMYANGGMIKRADGSYSQKGLWDNIRANKGSGKAPTKEMLKQERKINAKHADGGTIDNQAFAYDRWKRSLPDNLQNNDPAYNLKGYWEGLNRPEKFQPFEEQMQNDGYYHASTRNPETGEYYKGKAHPTTQHAIDADRKMGYYTEMKNNKIYTNKYTKGGRVLPRFAEAGTVATGAGITDYAGYAQMALPLAKMLMPDQQVKDDRGNVVGNKMDTGYAVGSKALDWGSKGLQYGGPAGAIALGTAGAIKGYLDNDENNRKIDKETRLANNSYYNEDTSKAFNTNTGNFTQRRSTNTNMTFAAGGQVVDEDMGNPNAELELNETFRDPMTGEAGMVDGPSHDDGGIEMSLAEGTQIWSDRLKHNGKTFASLTKPIINKIANIEKGLDTNPNSRFKQNSIKLLNAQLDFFFNVQESDKQQDEMKRTLKKQEGGVVDDMGNYHYANGGIYIKPENRNMMSMGGMMKYEEGGGISIGQINPTTGRAYTIEDVQAYNQGETIRPHVPGQLSGDTYTGGNMNFGQANRNFALNNSSGEYGPLNNQSFNQTIKREPANIPETIQGRQLPNYSFNQPINRTIVPTPETIQERQLPAFADAFASRPPVNNAPVYSGNNDPFRKMSNQYDPNIVNASKVNTTPVYQPYNSGATTPGGMINFNRGLPEPKLPQVYNSTPYIQKRGNQNPYKGTDITGNKTVGSNGEVTTASTPISKMDEFRNRIDSYRNRGKIGQGVTAAMSNITQADRLKGLARPDKISNVNYLSSMTGPDLVNYGNQRNTIEQGASAVVDKAGRYLGNSGSIMATVNAANLAKQQQLGESYQGQENANAAIMNQALAQKNQASIAQAERNSAIEQENYANKYGYDAMIASGLNANDAITASQMGKMFGNDVNFGNDLERARILGNKYAGKVLNSTDDNTSAENNSQLVESRFGGTIGKYADGGSVYRQELYNKAIGPNVKTIDNAAAMDAEYQQNLNAGNKQFTSKVTGLNYRVLPRSEKDLYAANMWKDTHGTAPTKSQVAATKKAIENKPTSSVKAKEVARTLETWNTQGMTPNNVSKKAQAPTSVPDFANQNTMQYMDQNNMPSFNTPNVEPTRNEIARMMKNVPTYKPGTYKQQAATTFESTPTDKRSKYTPSTAANPEYGNQNTMQYMNQNNMPTNFGPPKLTPNTNTKTIKMNEGLNQNYSDNTRTNLQANKSPKKQDQNIPMLNQKIGKPTIMNQGSDAYNDIKDYAKANETGNTSNIKIDTKNLPTPTEGARMVIETATKNADKIGKVVVPLPARMLVNDLFNKDKNTTTYTEKDWSKSGLEGLKKAVNTAKKAGRTYLVYADFDGISGTKMPEEQLGENLVRQWKSQAGKYSLGRANFKQKEDSTIITDRYNFNDKNDKNYFSNVKGRFQAGDNAGYAPIRALGTTFGSKEGEGSSSRVAIYNPENNNSKKKKKS
jgi:hypothetical protein